MSSAKPHDLKRELGFSELVVYYFSTIVGVGIFIVPLFAAKTAGPASLIAWLLALLCAYPFAMVFAQISQRYQVSGSIQKFLEDAWGVKFGKSMALFLVLSALFGNALLGFSAARYFNELFATDYNVYLLGCSFLLIPVLFNLLRIGLSSRIQKFCLVVLVILVEVIVCTAVPQYNVANLEPFAPNGFMAVVPAIVVCFYSIVGWENVDAMAEEVKNPGKIYRKAAKLAIGLIAFFYLSIAVTVVMVMDHNTLKDTSTVLTAILNISLGATASKVGGAVAIVLLILGANAWIFGTSRIIFALARDGILPKGLTKISDNKIPYSAVIAQMVPYLIIAFSFVLANLEEDAVVEITSLNYLMLYTVVFFSGIKSFSEKWLKILCAVAMTVTAVLLLQSGYMKVGVCMVLLLLCFVYVYYIKYMAYVKAKRHVHRVV